MWVVEGPWAGSGIAGALDHAAAGLAAPGPLANIAEAGWLEPGLLSESLCQRLMLS